MKRFLSLVLMISLLFTCSIVSFAESNNEKTVVYKGLEITSEKDLTEDDLEFLYDLANGKFKENKTDSSIIKPYYIPGDMLDGDILVYGPEKKYYNNQDVRDISMGIALWGLNKIPFAKSYAIVQPLVLSKLRGFINGAIPDTYAEAWVTKRYSSYEKRYIGHITLVHHRDSSYNSPISVQFVEGGYFD